MTALVVTACTAEELTPQEVTEGPGGSDLDDRLAQDGGGDPSDANPGTGQSDGTPIEANGGGNDGGSQPPGGDGGGASNGGEMDSGADTPDGGGDNNGSASSGGDASAGNNGSGNGDNNGSNNGDNNGGNNGGNGNTNGDTNGASNGSNGSTEPEPFDAVFLWTPILFGAATDLGFTPTELAADSQVPASQVQLVERSASTGLGAIVGRGDQHGVGVAFVDYDNDGWDDLFVINGSAADSKLLRNTGGSFTDVTAAAGLGTLFGDIDGFSIAAADYDTDGDVDVYIGARPTDVLLRNNGDGTFTDVTGASDTGGPSVNHPNSSGKVVSFGDYDGDGLMDIVSTYNPGAGGTGYLLRNEGDGTFEDITSASAFAPATPGNPCAVLWSDYDNDGDQDLWIWNDRGDSRTNRALLRNDSPGFVNVTGSAGIDADVGNPMGIDGADVDRDGFTDYYVSDIGNNPLYMGAQNGQFTNIAAAAGVRGDYGWGLAFEDFNGDGWFDLFVAQEDERPYLVFVHDQSVPPTFTRTEWATDVEGSNSHNVAAAFADYDHDGRVDALTATTDGTHVHLWHNETTLGTHGWLEVRVPRVPGNNARGGVSARIVVKTGDVVQFRDINGGSSRASQNAHSARFGLGHWTGADWVAALWPDGRQLVVTGVAGNQTLELSAP